MFLSEPADNDVTHETMSWMRPAAPPDPSTKVVDNPNLDRLRDLCLRRPHDNLNAVEARANREQVPRAVGLHVHGPPAVALALALAVDGLPSLCLVIINWVRRAERRAEIIINVERRS